MRLYLPAFLMPLLLLAACGDDGEGESTPPAKGPALEFVAAPKPEPGPVTPPLEGPMVTVTGDERVNYREDPAFRLPDATLLPLPEGLDGSEFQMPEEPECPEAWERIARAQEAFQICYPPDWVVDGHGYVRRGPDDRWYSIGFYKRDAEGIPSVHVSVYVMGAYSWPVLYVAECDQAYRMSLSGLPAAVCPDYPGVPPEAKIVAYHVRRGDIDYFVNVVPYRPYDEEEGGYLPTWSLEDEEAGLSIVRTLKFLEKRTADQ